MSDEVEIARFHHAGPREVATKVLAEAGIPFRTSDDSLTAEVSALGRASNASSILLVPAAHAAAARRALLDEARREVATSPPDDDHFLSSYADGELLEVVGQPTDWSEYDLAVAEYLLRKRGVSFPPSLPEADAAAKDSPVAAQASGEEPSPGIHAVSRSMITAGYVFASVFGIWGFIVGFSILCSTEPGPDGQKRYFYDERSRRQAAYLVVYAVVAFVALNFAARYYFSK